LAMRVIVDCFFPRGQSCCHSSFPDGYSIGSERMVRLFQNAQF